MGQKDPETENGPKVTPKPKIGLGFTLDPFWVMAITYGVILGSRVTLDSFWVWGSHWANFGSTGHFRSFFEFGVTFGPF